jgi:hypothetical protein
MTTTNQMQAAVKNLKTQHKAQWLTFHSKLKAVAAALNARTSDDILDDVTAAHFVAAGFTPEEAEVLVFLMTEDCMGQPVNSVEMIERWFCYCA